VELYIHSAVHLCIVNLNKHGENFGIRNANVFILVIHIAAFWAITTDSGTASILKVDHEDIVPLRRIGTHLQDYT
jgi:hypothetical protein